MYVYLGNIHIQLLDLYLCPYVIEGLKLNSVYNTGWK